MERNERRIAFAAIRYGDSIYTGPDHATIGQRMIKEGICSPPYPHGDDQGFLTNDGLYVRRAPALMIAIRSGQVKVGETINSKELFSEDLKKEK